MKKSIRLIAVLLAVMLLLAGCGKKESYAIKVGDQIITEQEYSRTILLTRSNYLSALGKEDSAELWETEVEEDTTLSQMLVDTTCDQLTNLKLFEIRFDELGLTLSEEDTKAIAADLEETVEAAGGMSAFHTLREERNYTYEEYESELYAHAKKDAVLNYYLGENGARKPTTAQDLKDWYNIHYAQVKALLIYTIDPETEEALTEDEIASVKRKAEEALETATRPSDTDLFDEVIELYGEAGTDGDGIVIGEESGYDEALTAAALDMKIGEVRLVEMESAYAVVKRYEGTSDQFWTEEVQQQTLETLRSDEIDELLESWKETHPVKINNKVIQSFRPENFVEE